MTETPLVSILIPAYNAEEYIADTIESALAQTWPRKEIIVVDDGSKDRTVEVARRFASRGVTVVSQPNSGASAARNKAFSLSTGDYIQWLDADDLLSPDKIAVQMKLLGEKTSRRTLLSGAWGRFIYRTGNARFEPSPLWADLSPVEWLVRKIGQNLHMQTATWLVSRELTEAAGPWDTRLHHDDDGEYFCRVIMASDGIRFTPEARVYYRISGPASVSYVGQSSKKLEALFLSMRLHIGYIRSLEDSPRVRAACKHYLQGPMVWFYPERSDIFEQARALGRDMGFELEIPRLSWKYAWIQKLFGWAVAKRVQAEYNQWKVRVIRAGDRLLSFRSFSRSTSHAT